MLQPMSTAPRDGTKIIVTKRRMPQTPANRKYHRFYARWQEWGRWYIVAVDNRTVVDFVDEKRLEGWEPV